ncbi:MAG: hypothetical protein ABSG46_19630, partial [Candidatus Binataceae bacterium]
GLFLEGVFYGLTGTHGKAISLLAVCSITAAIVMFAAFPETAGRELEEIPPEESVPAGTASP